MIFWRKKGSSQDDKKAKRRNQKPVSRRYKYQQITPSAQNQRNFGNHCLTRKKSVTYASINIAASCESLKLPSSPLFRSPNVQCAQSNSVFCNSFAANRKSWGDTFYFCQDERGIEYWKKRNWRTLLYVLSLNICLNSCSFHFSSATDVVACHR